LTVASGENLAVILTGLVFAQLPSLVNNTF
jgi:hypothetical protein